MNLRVVILCLQIVGLNFVLCTEHIDPLVKAVRKENYEIDLHYVTTKDGYILTMYHMPPKRTNISDTAKPRIMFFSHGLLGTSAEFITYRNISAAYFFVEHGFDVWMGNTRGTFLSPNHTTLDANSFEFWEYSWHEIGIYDLPAQIDYVLEATKQDHLSFIGHSQGATVGFVLLAELPEYSKKVKIFHAMASPVILKHVNLPADLLVKNMKILQKVAMGLRLYNIAPRWLLLPIIKQIGIICEVPSLVIICNEIMNVMAGRSAPRSWYPKIVSDVASFHPAGASIFQVIHYGQIVAAGRFQKFDFGRGENLKRYGNQKPPEYDLSNVRTIVHLLHGNSDEITRDQDIPILVQKLKHAKLIDSMIPGFNHFDFAYGRRVAKVQRKILSVENQYNPV